MTDLAEYLDAPPDDFRPPTDTDDEATVRWSIMQYPPEARDRVASWAMRRLATIQAERQRIVNVAGAEVHRIGEWVDSADKPLESDANFFRGCLTEYLRHIRRERGEDEDNPKTKSYKLPTGTIEGRRSPERIEVLDEARFIEWAAEQGYDDLVRVKREVNKVAIKAHIGVKDGVSIVLDTGERAPFVEVRRSPERFDAKPDVTP